MAWLNRLAAGPAEDFWLAFGLLALATTVSFGLGLLRLRSGRLYENTPTSRIRSAAQGYVELEGHARAMPGDPVIAPLTGGRCCWYRSCVEYRDAADKKQWTVISRELSGALFHLVDDTGACVVNPDGAQVLPSRREVWYGPLPKPPWGPRMGQGALRAATAKYRYTEERIDIGAPLYAIGLFRTHRGAEATAAPHEQLRELLVKWKRDARMMALFDRNADGRVDAAEWDEARKLARERVEEQTLREMPGEDVPVLGKPADSRPYILSSVTQLQLIRRERGRSALYLGLSVLSAASAAWLLALRGLL